MGGRVTVRDHLPHLILTGSVTRCCMDCLGQTKRPYPEPIIHESTCRRVRKHQTWEAPREPAD